MELAQVCFQLEAAFSLILQRALESELPHRVNPAWGKGTAFFVYFLIQTHRDFVRQETPYQSVHRWRQIAPISWRERKGNKCNFSRQTAPVRGAVLGERCGCGSWKPLQGIRVSHQRYPLHTRSKQLRYCQYKEYRLAGFFLGFLYEVINHCISLPSFHWLRANRGWGGIKSQTILLWLRKTQKLCNSLFKI